MMGSTEKGVEGRGSDADGVRIAGDMWGPLIGTRGTRHTTPPGDPLQGAHRHVTQSE